MTDKTEQLLKEEFRHTNEVIFHLKISKRKSCLRNSLCDDIKSNTNLAKIRKTTLSHNNKVKHTSEKTKESLEMFIPQRYILRIERGIIVPSKQTVSWKIQINA